jgi:hypothetical protein
MGKLCNEGETNILNVYLAGNARGPLYLGLYTNAAEPGETATLSTITEVPVAFSYARIALTNGDWGIWDDLATQLEKVFTAVGGAWGLVYGYFICDVASGVGGNLLWVEHFSDGPYNVLDTISVKVTPKILAA